MAPVASTLVDLAIALVLLFCLLPIYGVFPSRNIWAVPLMLMLVVVTAAGVGLWLSALNIKYRDFRYAVPFGIQLWLFASPVVYPASLVPEKWRPLYSINPMVGAIEGFRWALLGTEINLWPSVGVSALFAILIVLTGAMYFRNTERFFADLV
jgi:lipopolysaccharide transport system permease protein